MAQKPIAPEAKSVQITFRVPEEWLEEADWVAEKRSSLGLVLSRTDGFRLALEAGFKLLKKDGSK
jgi:hypothetical protein